ncbi:MULTISPECIES: enoyl-CoA hydratase/isomerase family protein [unclassified Duganella]|uniref:enoyl-CoA hydratase/isomerase family protein n=1 Tax=unclassified Duganella TaxID=2636909 RepID=UPI000E352E02|nr:MULTISPECIES: enoyl-CoA hydratase/isomerase family protein [unclassified Duganella]RFP19523.1 enoyl-CoA hydratase/isomerase family protein [Duganella sp. BJB475]RFP36104.1 enoyl-CoA hydratase/isomerase family protein [Duganella sp. BJB476]
MRDTTTMENAPAVLLEARAATDGKRIGVATLNAPASLHALTLNMIRMLYIALQDWAKDDTIACVMLQSSTDKAFCAGGDVRTLRNAILAEPSVMPNQQAQAFFSEEYRLDHLIHTYPKPLVVWGGGIVMGGGLGLLAGASHRVVTPTTRIAMPEITIGLFPDVGGSWFLPRMPGRSGLFLGLTGASLNAHDALFTGLGDYFLPQEQRAAVVEALCAVEWSTVPAIVVDRVLRSLSLAPETLPASEVRQNWDTITAMTASRELSEVVAAITGYQGDSVWLQRAAAALAKGAPSSVALVWEMQQRSRHLSLADVFRLELVVALQCCAHPDFAEGVRALLVEKDNAPQWSPSTLDEAQARVGEFFEAPGPQHPLADLN